MVKYLDEEFDYWMIAFRLRSYNVKLGTSVRHMMMALMDKEPVLDSSMWRKQNRFQIGYDSFWLLYEKEQR